MQTATFDPAGGPLAVEISSGEAQPGSYTFLLWEAGVNRVVMEEKGNFINEDDDSYPLPGPAAANDGRIAEALVTVVVTPPITDYHAELVITQDGRVIGRESASGTGASGAVTADLYVKLAAGGGA